MSDRQHELPLGLPPLPDRTARDSAGGSGSPTASPEQPATNVDWRKLYRNAARRFRPTTPVTVLDVFAGREREIDRVCDVVTQDGQHAVLFGERGVGKTSLANVLSAYLDTTEEEAELGLGPIISPRVNCDTEDTFDTVWRKVLKEIKLTKAAATKAGFAAQQESVEVDGFELLPTEYTEEPNPRLIDIDAVRSALTILGQQSIPILIIDEFDRLPPLVRRSFADLIKSLSDHITPATVVLVGVADSVDGLLSDHQSVGRALVQVNLPRMEPKEIRRILVAGAASLNMTFDESSLVAITRISQGLPHYAHLIGLNAVRTAIQAQSLRVEDAHVGAAVRSAARDVQQSVQGAYLHATQSAQSAALFSDVLLACALADTDELGRFRAQDVRAPLRQITQRDYDIPNFAQHLSDFCSDKRGDVLSALGDQRRRSYRFRDPLMQPFVIMQGMLSGRLPSSFLHH